MNKPNSTSKGKKTDGRSDGLNIVLKNPCRTTGTVAGEESVIPEHLLKNTSQRQFRHLLTETIHFLRMCSMDHHGWGPAGLSTHKTESTAQSTGHDCPVTREVLLDDGPCLELSYKHQQASQKHTPPSTCGPVPQILFEVTWEFQRWGRRKVDIAYWYYQDLLTSYNLHLDSFFQRDLRLVLQRLAQLKQAQDEHDLPPSSTENPTLSLQEVYLDDESLTSDQRTLRNALFELITGLGMVQWPTHDKKKTGGHIVPTLLSLPEASVVIAKLFGFKTDIRGLDDLLGGGLVLQARSASPQEGATDSGAGHAGRASGQRAILGVIRGRFGSGKSTLAAQLAFEMARKGGAGLLLVLEQTVEEVLSQAYHYGWLPDDIQFKLVKDSSHRASTSGFWKEFQQAVAECHKKKMGVLGITRAGDASMRRFGQLLEQTTRIPYLKEYFPRFLVADPLDAVQISARDASATAVPREHMRNRTDQVLHKVTDRGVTLWLTTTDVDPDKSDGIYSFLPNLGDLEPYRLKRSSKKAGNGGGSHEAKRIFGVSG